MGPAGVCNSMVSSLMVMFVLAAQRRRDFTWCGMERKGDGRGMTKSEIRMTKECRMTNGETGPGCDWKHGRHGHGTRAWHAQWRLVAYDEMVATTESKAAM